MKAATWVMVGFTALACIPKVNAFFVLLIMAGGLVGTVLGIVMMAKGAVGKGVRTLIGFWIGLPLLVLTVRAVTAILTGEMK
ncbi:MAG TPA: hypothetical protein VD994_21820 [Prosthecobacter sp.]|nr:hypothetical protein [Prosthecobacter sp.]